MGTNTLWTLLNYANEKKKYDFIYSDAKKAKQLEESICMITEELKYRYLVMCRTLLMLSNDMGHGLRRS